MLPPELLKKQTSAVFLTAIFSEQSSILLPVRKDRTGEFSMRGKGTKDTTQRGFAKLLGVSINSIIKHRELGIIPNQRIGWIILFDPIEAAEALQERGLSARVRNAAERFLSAQEV
jgi:hypothetical protein